MRTPVIIPARNEQANIERTLSRLAQAEVDPLVVANGSTDDTASLAKYMGARVIELENPGKMPAVQTALRHFGQRALGPVLILDADTRPVLPKPWQSSMEYYMRHRRYEGPVVVGGPIFFDQTTALHGVLHSLSYAYHNIARTIRSDNTIGQCGPNMGIHLKTKAMLDTVLDMPHLWPGEDRAIAQAVIDQGGDYVEPVYPLTYTITRIHESLPTLQQRLTMSTEERIAHSRQSYRERGSAGSVPYEG